MGFIKNYKIKIVLVALLFTQSYLIGAQEIRKGLTKKIDTTSFDFISFAKILCVNKSSNLERAKTLLHFVSNSLEWLPTDYKQRSEKEILARGGGNCFELAKVYMKLINALEIKYRPVAEINVNAKSDQRQRTAEKKVIEKGNRMSVFGKNHNDHRWVEVYNDSTDSWIPIDPTMNVFGVTEWLKARVWFGSRVTIDTLITNDMVVPFAIFVNNNAIKKPWESRSAHYLIDEFNKLYNFELESLPSWNKWVNLIKEIDNPVKQAFAGKENLHNYFKEITAIENSYYQLKQEYEKFKDKGN